MDTLLTSNMNKKTWLLFLSVYELIALASILLIAIIPYGPPRGGGSNSASALVNGYKILSDFFAAVGDKGFANKDTWEILYAHINCVLPFYLLIFSSVLFFFKKLLATLIINSILIVLGIIVLIAWGRFFYYPGSYLWIILLGISIAIFVINKKFSIV